jgi:hypothetical protein
MFEDMMADHHVVGGLDAVAGFDDLDAMPARDAGRAWIDVEAIASAAEKRSKIQSAADAIFKDDVRWLDIRLYFLGALPRNHGVVRLGHRHFFEVIGGIVVRCHVGALVDKPGRRDLG